MKMIKISVLLAFLTLSLAAAGCSGGGAKVQQQTTTLGQELQDLDAAYQKGLLSEKEYKRARKALIEKHTD